GDTEFTGTAAETKATVRLKLELIKGKKIPWMRIEKAQSIVSVFASRPLEVAVETATINLIDWLISDHGYTPTDAYCLVSTCPDFRINVYQMCRLRHISYVARAESPRKYLLKGEGSNPRRRERQTDRKIADRNIPAMRDSSVAILLSASASLWTNS